MLALNREVKAAKEKGENLDPIFEAARNKAEKEREAEATACQEHPNTCGFGREIADDAYNEYLENGFLLGIDDDVARFMQQETSKDNAVIDQYTSQFGKDMVVAAEAASWLAGAGISYITPKGYKGPKIQQIPDVYGKLHATAVKGDAHIPVDKVELWLRGGEKGDFDALIKQRELLRTQKNADQSTFAKSGKETELKAISESIKRIDRTRVMGDNLIKSGVPNTPKNNAVIMDELLESAKDVNASNPSSSIVLHGTIGSVRINAKWKVMDDGTKRLTTMTTGIFKDKKLILRKRSKYQ